MNSSKKIRLCTPILDGEEFNLIKEVLQSGYLTEGSKAKEFEEKIANYIGIKHAILTTNCTTALEISLRIGDVGTGDEVIVPDFTYPATALAVENVGATPILVDIDFNTRSSSAEGIEAGINEKTKALILVSLFGNAVSKENMRRIQKLSRKHDLLLIEDAACSMGVKINGEMVGTQTDLSCFSFHPRKVITTGEGGAIVTNHSKFAEKIFEYKLFGMNKIHEFVSFGTNCKMSDILAAVGIAQLDIIEEIITTRREKARIYDDLLENSDICTIPSKNPHVRNTYQTYVVLLDKKLNRDKIIEKMANFGIETQIGSYSLSKLPHFKDTRKIEPLKNSHILYSCLLSLPLHYKLSDSEQQFVVEKLKESITDIK
ncbi:MAG: DegT/DnrJ/EryC1/StrS family aminotransferase [Candidatus Hodarchaeales archaeon]